MIPVFADAGYLIALDSERDQHHAQAVRHWNEFGRTGPTLVTTTFVLAEVIAVFNNRSGHAKAVEIGRRFFDSKDVRLIHPNEEVCRAAFDYLEARPDKEYSLADCISFAVMERLRIREALSFDAHFQQAGFVRLPRS